METNILDFIYLSYVLFKFLINPLKNDNDCSIAESDNLNPKTPEVFSQPTDLLTELSLQEFKGHRDEGMTTE